MNNRKLNKLIKQAELACEESKGMKGSLVERLKPYVHYNNLLMLKFQNILDDEKSKNRNKNSHRK